MPDTDPTQVDPSVTPDELDQATQPPAGAFPIVDDQDLVEPDALARSLIAPVPATPAQMIANFRRMREHHTPIGGVGLCLYDVRHFGWNVGALWPTANDAAHHGNPIHRFKRFADVPRGMTIVFVNNHLGHITAGLGGALNNTSDYHEPGFNGVATIANTAEWCNATDWYGIETVNGVDVYPNPKKPKPKPKPFTLAERIQIVRGDMRAAKAKGHEHRAARYKLWLTQLERRLEAQK